LKDYHACRQSAGTFMTCVDELAVGDATVITPAGARPPREPGTLPSRSHALRTKPWRLSAEPGSSGRGPGRGNYLVELT